MMIKKIFRHVSVLFTALLAVTLFSTQAQSEPFDGAPSGAYEVDLSHASVVWKVSHSGFSTYVGRFTDFAADLTLDTEDFGKSSVSVDIKVDSIATAFPWPEEENFDEKLAKKWFKSEEFPSITFATTAVSPLVDNKAKVTGQMTMLGQSHPVVLDIVFNKGAASHPFKKVPIVGFSATTSLDRTVWGLSKYAPNIGAEVVVEIEGEFLMKK